MIKRNFITVIICCILLGLTACYSIVKRNRLSVQAMAGFTKTNFGVKLFITTIPCDRRTDATLLLGHKISQEPRNKNVPESTWIAVETDSDFRVIKNAVNSRHDLLTELHAILIDIIANNIIIYIGPKCNQV